MITHALKAGDATRLRPRPSLQPATVLDFLVAWKEESCATGVPWSYWRASEPSLLSVRLWLSQSRSRQISRVLSELVGQVSPGRSVSITHEECEGSRHDA